MNLTTIMIAIGFTVFTAVSALAGGVACQFKADGLPLLSQSPVLAEILSSKFSVQEGGKMGPMDAPFDDGRLYTYMEFRASSVADHEQKFIIRLHFKKKSRTELTFERVEILPLNGSPRNQEGKKT